MSDELVTENIRHMGLQGLRDPPRGKGYQPHTGVRVINELNLMDGDHADKNVNISLTSVSFNYDLGLKREDNPERVIEARVLEAEVVETPTYGKTTSCIMEIFSRAREQQPDSEGVRRTRW